MKIKLILMLMLLSVYQQTYSQVPNEVLCNNYQFQMVEDFGCGNFKFRKDCDLETIWDWGDGSPKTISNDKFVMHKFCKIGQYNVSISLSQSPSIIRYQLVVNVYEEPSLGFTYTIISQTDCENSVVKFQSITNCIESYDLNGLLIPGSDQIEWDFGDGTTSTEANPKHTFTSGGNFHVNLRAVSSTCDLEETKMVDLGDPVTCCLDNVVFDHINWTPNESEIINGSTIKIKSELRVIPGVELTLNNVRLEMGKDAKIIVERGAALVLNNSVVTTTSCGGYVWEGIEVWGSGDWIEQNYTISPFGNVGWLKVDGSLIENADEAITVSKKRSLAFYDIASGFNGGVVRILNSTFKNNYTSINIWPYKNCVLTLQAEPCTDCSKYSNASYIRNNTFLCNAPMRDERYTIYPDEVNNLTFRAGLNHFIFASGTYGLDLVNNEFINNYLTPPIKYRGAGVVLTNSRVNIRQQNVTYQKRIRGLTTGIRVSADNSMCRSLSVSNYLFSGCQVAIDANSTAIEIKNNNIAIPNTVSPITAQGIHTRNCRSFKINENILNGISIGNKYGILMRNNRSGVLSNNTINNLHIGSQSEQLNNGVAINCNYYQNQNFSITVPNGKIADQGQSQLAAGNVFVDDCKASSQNLNDIKSNVAFKYYFYNDGNQNPTCKSSIVSTFQSGMTPNCNYTVPLPPCSPNCTKDLYVQSIYEAFVSENFVEVNRLKLEMQTILYSMEGGYDVYKTYLDSISEFDVEAGMILASTYLNDGDYNKMNNVLNKIQNFNTEESEKFIQLMNVLQNVYTENRELNELNEEEVLMLNELSMNDTTNASYIAEGILYQFYNYDYNHNPVVWNEGNRIKDNNSVPEFSVFPNPTNGWVTINAEKSPIISLYIYNVLGEMVYKAENVFSKEHVINTIGFSNGIYTVKINTFDKVLNEKLLIE